MDRICKTVPTLEEDIKNQLEANKNKRLKPMPTATVKNNTDWEKAQDACIALSSHPNERVRVNAALGFAYIAQVTGKLDKRIVKPALLQLLNTCGELQNRIIDAVKDVNYYTGWNIDENAEKTSSV